MIMNSDDLVLVGRVARAHGIRGQVIVNPETDFLQDRFKSGQMLLVGPAEQPIERRIEDVRFHQGRPILAFGGVEYDETMRSGLRVWTSGCRSSRWRRSRSGRITGTI